MPRRKARRSIRRSSDAEKAAVTIQQGDFLARRTAVLGMMRTGKSNMVKHTISVVKRVADEGGGLRVRRCQAGIDREPGLHHTNY